MRTLVTGAAGFIGMHVCDLLLDRGEEVIGVDELNDYYPKSLKHARMQLLRKRPGFHFVGHEIGSFVQLPMALAGIERVIHLAAWAGVRYSTEHPLLYGQANIMATLRLFDACQRAGIKVITYASSSSAKKIASVYGATKRACDDLAEAFAPLHGMALTGLRYHTVYGPWGRPDMAMWKFARAALDGTPIELYNNGDMDRDFTYVADIVKATVAAHDKPAALGEARVMDIGRGHSRKLKDMVALVEQATGRPIERRLLPMQAGDVESSLADNARARAELGYDPTVDLEDGIPAFVVWYREHRAAGGCP